MLHHSTPRKANVSERTVSDRARIFTELQTLVAIEGTSGDEGRVTDAVMERCASLPGLRHERIQDNLIVWRGKPQVALFAHLDTVGFTLGYDGVLVRIGGPAIEGGEALRSTHNGVEYRGQVLQSGDGWKVEGAEGAPCGTRWVYDQPLELNGVQVQGPYLDNRAGVWSALEVLSESEDAAVAFTTNEEHSGRGATTCARWLHERLDIRQALISDITWHTEHIHCGRGPAVSLRDRNLPRQAFLDRVLSAAEASGMPFQREIESDGSSDGGAIERSGVPMDWVFVGAPQKDSHTPHEVVDLNDLGDMARLTAHLVQALGTR
jgi:putative aminopeptidase FrvX